jgi:hypothetical protein
MEQPNSYQGHCFCGDVQFTVNGKPEAMAYCHCESCRHWSAGPVSAFTLWKPESLQITQGANKIRSFDKKARNQGAAISSNRQWCSSCGGHILTDHPTMGLIDIPAAVLADFIFEARFHVHYQETVLPILDGLPKYKDLPKEAGGSGKQLSQ